MSDRAVTAANAAAFRGLHAAGHTLVLPCVWDPVGARLLARHEGVRALGTTSAGIAASHGLPDGQVLDAQAMLAAVAAIVASTALPVSADLEWGYGRDPDEVGEFVASALDVGVVGINLEDVSADGACLAGPREHAARILAARRVARRAGVDLFISARTDVWWRTTPADPAERFAEGVGRLRTYVAAGADSVFVPGYPAAGDGPAGEAIARLGAALNGAPLHLLANPRLPALRELPALGVCRVSTGSALYRTALAAAADACEGMLRDRSWAALEGADALPYGDLARLLGETVTPPTPAGRVLTNPSAPRSPTR